MIELISLVSKMVPEDELLDLLSESINQYKSTKSEENKSTLTSVISIVGYKYMAPKEGISDFEDFMKERKTYKEAKEK